MLPVHKEDSRLFTTNQHTQHNKNKTRSIAFPGTKCDVTHGLETLSSNYGWRRNYGGIDNTFN